MQGKILSVTMVSLAILRHHTTHFLLRAVGTTNTSGWKDGELIPRVYVTPPADGIWDFDFVATRPTGIVFQVISTIESAPFVAEVPPWFRGVRVHASSNSVTHTADVKNTEQVDARYIPREITDNGADVGPWPAPAGNQAATAKNRSFIAVCLTGSITDLNPISICMDGATHRLNTVFASPVRLKATNNTAAAALDQFNNAKVLVTVCGNWIEGPECSHLDVYHVGLGGIAPNKDAFLVIALTAGLPEHTGCAVIPENSIMPAIYSVVFGPASAANCEKWLKKNCGK